MAHKLLLADDSITMQKIVELMLAGEGFEVKSTNNGEETLGVIPSFKPDVVLADIEMPKINGYQLCEKIKKDPSMSKVPVILLAGAFEPIDENILKQVRADDFIVKPFESQELISKINAVLVAQAVVQEEVGVAEAAGEEAVAAEEDLWAMEDILDVEEVEVVPEGEEEKIGIGEIQRPAEKAGVAVEAVAPGKEVRVVVPEAKLPSEAEIKEIFEKAIHEKVSSFISSLDIKEAVFASVVPLIRDSVEKVIPDLAGKVLREILENSLKSLSQDIEKVIWETVPDLAETIISKEIERIRSEF